MAAKSAPTTIRTMKYESIHTCTLTLTLLKWGQ